MADPSPLDLQLTELEEKIDRVRALYEQYFMGIERLEPLIPRKDIERRILGLRKEQMRNTAIRFKFNTLCQRFSTMQHHWGRICREIENGTYKRDVARAAARFGADEVLTAVGRRRAAGLQKVLETQKKEDVRREEERRQAESVPPQRPVDDEEDAPTPPPQGGRPHRPPQHSYDIGRFAAPSVDDAAGAKAGFSSTAARAPDPAAMGFPDVDMPQPVAPAQPAAAAATPAEALKKAPAGLRLGALGVRRVTDPDAARKRLEELAAKMGGGAPEPAAPQPAARFGAPGTPPAEPVAAPRVRRFDPDEIMALGVPGWVPPPAPQHPKLERPSPVIAPSDPGTDSARRPPPAPAFSPGASSPASSVGGSGPASAPGRPLGLRPPSAGRASTPDGVSTPPPPVAQGAASLGPASGPGGPSAADRAAVKRADVAAQGGRGDMAEPRVREIYKEFIEAKRRSNESTAAITYDKLADSLRKQMDKLKTEHKDRRIDFAVVTKDGKTMIKPIIK